MASPLAALAVSVSWAVTAATAPNSHPVVTKASPRAADPGTPVPSPIMPAARSTPITRLATRATRRAAVSGARRPTTPEPSSSRRPVSSSARVYRTTSSTLSSPVSAAPLTPILHIVMAPIEVGARRCP